MLLLIYSSGLRISDVIRMQKDDLQFKRRLVHIRKVKGNKDRYFILSDKSSALLIDYIDKYNPVNSLFEGQYGDQYSETSIRKVFNRAVKQAGLPKKGGTHVLQHSFATHLLEQGVDIRYIQELLGYKSSKTIEIYTHVSTKKISMIKSPGDFLSI